ncbi:MAG: universal stress protein [Desulfovibrionaceae bacterium]|nr:universal stress protein [Desulfovibrionaceae bacterium]
MFKDIVLAVTPSEICECAADAAFSFAQRFEAKLYIVHVAGIQQGWGAIEHLAASGETERIRQQIEEHYAEKLKGVPDYKVIVVPGMPHAEILRLARKFNSDLIIMGPHTKEYAEKRSKMWGMTGSTLERVSQKSRCPVMIVTRATPYGEQSFANIVVATDFSEAAECAVSYGSQLARQYKANLNVFHVLDIEGLAGQMAQTEIDRRVNETKQRMENEFGERLSGVKNCTYDCWEGKPAMEILKIARMKEADLILMAHHSKETDPEKAFLGSTVTQVALNAACPTMSINRYFDLRCGLMYDQTGEAKAV